MNCSLFQSFLLIFADVAKITRVKMGSVLQSITRHADASNREPCRQWSDASLATLNSIFIEMGSLEPRLSFVGGKESLVHTVCAYVNISVNFSVKLSGYYQRTRGLARIWQCWVKYGDKNKAPQRTS